MLHIYSSIKYAVLLLPLSPTRQAAMSLPPSARKGRQVFAPHISTSHESHSNHDSVVFQQRTSAEGLTQLQKLYWESAAFSEAPEQLVTRDTLKPQSLWGGGYYSSAGNPTCRQAGQRWFLILPPSGHLCNSHQLLTEQDGSLEIQKQELVSVSQIWWSSFLQPAHQFHPTATLYPCSAWQERDASLIHLS